MLRVAGRRLSFSSWNFSPAAFASRGCPEGGGASRFVLRIRAASSSPVTIVPELRFPIRGFSSGALSQSEDMSVISGLPATVAAIENPTSKIMYDEYNHELFPPGDPSKRVFAYFALTGGRFVYASLVHLLVLKFVLSKDVLSLAALEVDLLSIEP